LLGPESRLDGKARQPHAFFERAGGGDIRGFVDDYLRHYTITKTRGYISIPTGNHDTPRPTWGRNEQDVRIIFAMLLTMPGVPFIYYGDEIGMKFLPAVPKQRRWIPPREYRRSSALRFSDTDAVVQGEECRIFDCASRE